MRSCGRRDKLIQAGKFRPIGSSQPPFLAPGQDHYVAKAMGVAPYITAQDHYNILRRQIESRADPVP